MYLQGSPTGCIVEPFTDGAGYSPTDAAPSWYQEVLTTQQLLNGIPAEQLAAALDANPNDTPATAANLNTVPAPGAWSQALADMRSQAGQTPYWGSQAQLLFSGAQAAPVPVSAATCTRKPFAYAYEQCDSEQLVNVTSSGAGTDTTVVVEQPTSAWLIAASILGAAALLG